MAGTDPKPNDNAPEQKADKTTAALAKAFEEKGEMEPGYVYRYQTVPAGETVITELVVEKRS